MTIYIGSDHNGFYYKNKLVGYLTNQGHLVVDCGDQTLDPGDDFPKFASEVVLRLLADRDHDSRAILICGSGQGMCMAANRYKGIRASLCWNNAEAFSARNDDDANVLCLSASQHSYREVTRIINVWLSTPFAGAPRYVRRIKQLDKLG